MATRPRIELQTVLEEVLGSEHVYFQPPESFKLHYPCIVYQLSNIASVYADNQTYQRNKNYQVTIIDKDPDSDIPNRLMTLPYCRFNRFFPADHLNHWVFTLFY